MGSIGEILEYAKRTGAINFGPGLPDPDVFPVEEIKKAVEDIDKDELNYTEFVGREDLRELLRKFLERKGIEEREVIVTSAVQEAIALVGLLLRGKKIGMSNPAYSEALKAFRSLGVEVEPVEMDKHGEKLPDSENVYLIPTGHNPTGRTMDEGRRNEFASSGKLIIEDATYEDIVYEKVPPPISSLTENSFYMYSFSKVLSPSLRMGILAVPEEYYKELSTLRSALNVCASPLSQAVMVRLLERGILERSIERAKEVYRKKRDVMVKELRSVAEFEVPKAGFFIWANMERDAMEVLLKLKNRGVVYVPGEVFYVKDPDKRYARLAFSYESVERIEKGVRIMREVLEK